MKKIVSLYFNSNLVIRILCFLVIGIVLALLVEPIKSLAADNDLSILISLGIAGKSTIALLGSIFVGALRALAPILVFVLVISSLSNAGSGIGKQFSTVIFLYMLSTLLAAGVAVVGSFLFPVTLEFKEAAEGAAPSGLGEVIYNLIMSMVTNPLEAITTANYIGILSWAIIFGIAIKKAASENTKQVINDLSDTITKAIRWIIQFAPFGIMGLVFDSVSSKGLDIFTSYGKLLALLIGCMLTVALIVNPIIVALCLKRNPYPLVFRCLRQSGITAFFTRSSAANIPINMALCERLNLDKNVYSVSIPLGATINMNGAAVTITVMSLAVANTLGIEVSLPTALVLSVIATIGACGSSGVAGGSLLLIPLACSLLQIPGDIAMQAVGIGFIIGVVQDSMETALNSSGDVLFAATAEFMSWKKIGKKIEF